jgi:hypothetical protein
VPEDRSVQKDWLRTDKTENKKRSEGWENTASLQHMAEMFDPATERWRLNEMRLCFQKHEGLHVYICP